MLCARRRSRFYLPSAASSLLAFSYTLGLLLSIKTIVTASDARALLHEPEREAGYIKLRSAQDAAIFYYFFPSRDPRPDDPVALWIHGGPGCSGALAVYHESGPYRFDVHGNLEDNFAYGWDAAGINMIYVDQPVNVGWSYANADADHARDEKTVARHIVDFMTGFFELHPELVTRDLFLAGVSYAGHMVPPMARALLTAQQSAPTFDTGVHTSLTGVLHDSGNGSNATSAGTPLSMPQRLPQLRGIALGNPWVAPQAQYAKYAEFALGLGLISAEQAAQMEGPGMTACSANLDACWAGNDREVCLSAWRHCQSATFNVITASNPGINPYDVRKKCISRLCYDFSAMEAYLQRQDVRRQLGVGNRTWDGPCSSSAHSDLMPDWARSYDGEVAQLLDEGLQVMVYAGSVDLTCPWPGQLAWLEALAWRGAAAFAAAPARPLMVSGQRMGSARSAGGLTFVTVEGAGHEAPMDQPEAVMHLLARFTRGHDVAGSGGLDGASVVA